MKTVIRTAYNDPYIDLGLQNIDIHGEEEKSLTVQSEKDACDINVIVENFAKTGLLPGAAGVPAYGDFSEATVSFQEAHNIVINAQNAFNALPAKIRKEFDNDPGKFLDFVDDPKNADELIKMGLREAPKQTTSEVTSDTPPKGGSETPSE